MLRQLTFFVSLLALQPAFADNSAFPVTVNVETAPVFESQPRQMVISELQIISESLNNVANFRNCYEKFGGTLSPQAQFNFHADMDHAGRLSIASDEALRAQSAEFARMPEAYRAADRCLAENLVKKQLPTPSVPTTLNIHVVFP